MTRQLWHLQTSGLLQALWNFAKSRWQLYQIPGLKTWSRARSSLLFLRPFAGPSLNTAITAHNQYTECSPPATLRTKYNVTHTGASACNHNRQRKMVPNDSGWFIIFELFIFGLKRSREMAKWWPTVWDIDAHGQSIFWILVKRFYFIHFVVLTSFLPFFFCIFNFCPIIIYENE